MRTIKIELTLSIPDYYQRNNGRTNFGEVNYLLDQLEDAHSEVSFVDGKIIGEQNDGKK